MVTSIGGAEINSLPFHFIASGIASSKVFLRLLHPFLSELAGCMIGSFTQQGLASGSARVCYLITIFAVPGIGNQKCVIMGTKGFPYFLNGCCE